MIGLPTSTEFNRRIPKQKFYENLDISPALKRVFVEQIKIIYWRNKIAPSTMNFAEGEKVTEIEVFEIKLNAQIQPEPILRLIDKAIPYHILFLLEYDGKYQAWTAYKEASSGTNSFKVLSYYHTEWLNENDLIIKLDGLNMDSVYENIVRQIGGEILLNAANETLKESINKDIRRKELKKQIEALQTMIRREKQLNKQVQINAELKQLRKELEKLI